MFTILWGKGKGDAPKSAIEAQNKAEEVPNIALDMLKPREAKSKVKQ